ncbi:hypothetical protein [Microvirga aerophila]|uniref:Uncharacterized protein n=2 Tax=Microvirga aerophila TaxID=670291 RepID=A0A512BVL3_9HYPH|nr:hypothetical protein [Microvirga aerophila]GEO16008.1 hypothetical protein MAE02_37040 [Microvirga aerophila]
MTNAAERPVNGRTDQADTLTGVITFVAKQAKSFYDAKPDGDWPMTIFAFSPTGCHVLQTHFNVTRREETYAAFSEAFKELGVESYVVASEAWAGRKGSTTPPFMQADRREILLITAVDMTGTATMTMDITRNRKGKVIKLTPGVIARDGAGPLTELLA